MLSDYEKKVKEDSRIGCCSEVEKLGIWHIAKIKRIHTCVSSADQVGGSTDRIAHIPNIGASMLDYIRTKHCTSAGDMNQNMVIQSTRLLNKVVQVTIGGIGVITSQRC